MLPIEGCSRDSRSELVAGHTHIGVSAVRRLSTLALVILAVFALATIAASLPNVSTDPSLDPSGGAVSQDESGTASSGGGGGQPGDGDEGGRSTSDSGTSSAAAERQVPLWQVAGGLGLFALASLLALYALTRGADAEGEAADRSSPTEPAVPDADSVTLVTDPPASNDVYRAWNALCRAVSADPGGETPAAVARAAIDAGYDPVRVRELTGTFCRVRYGDWEPTGDHEQTARELAASLSLDAPAGEWEP